MTNIAVPTYSLAERERRWTAARDFMDREGVDALLVFSEHEDAGPAPFCFDTWFTNDRPGATVIFPRTGNPVSLVWGPPAVNDRRESTRRGDAEWISPENMRVGRDLEGLADALNEHGLSSGTIGVVGLEPYRPFHSEGFVTYGLWSKVLARFPDAEFKPVGLAFGRLIAPLSQEEIAAIRYSASIGDEMARAMVEAAGPGVPESVVYAAGMAAAYARGTVVPLMHLWTGPEPTGAGPPQWAYRPQMPRVLQDGDLIKAEVFCNFGMRSTQHQVMIAIGEVHEDFERAELLARESYDAGLQALRPGRTFGEVVAEMRKPLEAVGSSLRSPLVHTMNPFVAIGGGVVLTSPEMQLEPGMSFAFEPRHAIGGRGVTIGGTVLVGDDEPIELNSYTARLLHANAPAAPAQQTQRRKSVSSGSPADVAVPTYSLKERDRRWNLARSFMNRSGLDALIVYGEHEDSGPAPFYFDTWFTNDRPGTIVIFPRDGEPLSMAFPTAIADHKEAVRRGDIVWMPAENIRIARDIDAIAQVIDEHGLGKGTIGVAGLEPYRPALPDGIIPFRLWNAVRQRFPEADFKLVGSALGRLMAPLGDEELAAVRHSASIGDEMAWAMVEVAGAGVSESEVYAAGMAAALSRGTVVPGMHLWSGPDPLGAGPPQWAYRPQAPRILQDGDIIGAEVFCTFGMRATQHQVTIAIGAVHPEFERAGLIARESYEAGLRVLRPGRKFGEVVDEMRKPVEEAGGQMTHPLIHTLNPMGSVGGGAATTNAEMELEPGMTFAFEPRYHRDRCLVTVGGTVIVGDDEPIELNPYTAQILRAGMGATSKTSPSYA